MRVLHRTNTEAIFVCGVSVGVPQLQAHGAKKRSGFGSSLAAMRRRARVSLRLDEVRGAVALCLGLG